MNLVTQDNIADCTQRKSVGWCLLFFDELDLAY